MSPAQRRKAQARIIIWGLLFVGVLVVAFQIKATWHVYQKEGEALEAYNRESEEYQALLDRKNSLETSVARLSTPRGVEEVVRTRYPLVKEGEEVIMLVDRVESVKTEATTTPTFWDSLKRWFW